MASRGQKQGPGFSLERVPLDKLQDAEDKDAADLSQKVMQLVLENATKAFEAEGVDPNVVKQLGQLWSSKLTTTGTGNCHEAASLELQDAHKEVVAQKKVSARKKKLAKKAKSSRSKCAVKKARVSQLDGPNDDTSDDDEDLDPDDDDDDNDDDDDDEDNLDNDDDADDGAEEEPLGSGDDISDEDPDELFNTENVVVCQYDKITRARNKWKFHLKDGIMNLNGKDYVFQKATGDAEW